MATAQREIKVEDAGPCRKKISVTVPADLVAEHLGTATQTVLAQAELPGFRRGRAPRQLIEKRFGEHIRGEAKNQLIASAYSEAVESHKLAVLGDPEPGEGMAELEVAQGKPLSFSVEVEIVPEFELPSVEGVQVYKPIIEVTDKMIDEQLDKIGLNEGELESQEVAKPGDYCIGHGVMKNKAGETIIDVPDAVVQIPADAKADPKGAILGVIVDDFAKQVGLPKPGDSVTIKTKGPESHENPRVRNADLTIDYAIERVERIVPATREQLVEKFGLESTQALREAMTARLNQRAVLEQNSVMRQQVAKHLTDAIEFELPERVSAAQAERNLNRARYEMMYRGLDPQAVEQRIAELRSTSGDTAKRQLKLFFILAKVARERGVEVTEQEVQNRIRQIAAQRGVAPNQVAGELSRNNQISTIVQQIREHKVMDQLLRQAKIEEISLDEFNKKFSEQEMPEA
ncbi:MAG: trigger factor [Phycisphaerales bacterium]